MEDDSSDFDAEFAAAAQALSKGEGQKAASTEGSTGPSGEAVVVEGTGDPAPETPAPEAGKPEQGNDLAAQLSAAAERERASAARASHVARENNQLRGMIGDLQRQLRERLSAGPQASAPTTAPSTPSQATASAEPDVLSQAPDLESAVLRRAKDLLRPIEDQLSAVKARAEAAERDLAQTRQVVEPLSEEAWRREVAATHQGLDQTFGKAWRADVQGPEFADWLATQPKATQDLYQSSPRLADSAGILTQFYLGTGRGLPKPDAAAAPAQQARTPPNVQRARDAAGIASSRSGAVPSGPGKEDFDGNFAIFSQQIARAA